MTLTFWIYPGSELYSWIPWATFHGFRPMRYESAGFQLGTFKEIAG